MAIRNVVTRGYGAGATIAFVSTRGYTIGAAAVVPSAALSRMAGRDSFDRMASGGALNVGATRDDWSPEGHEE